MSLDTFITQVAGRKAVERKGRICKYSFRGVSGGEHLPHSTLCLIQGSQSMWLRAGQSAAQCYRAVSPIELFFVLETTGSELKKNAFLCAVLAGFIQQRRNLSAVGAMNGRPVVTLRSKPLRFNKALPRQTVVGSILCPSALLGFMDQPWC